MGAYRWPEAEAALTTNFSADALDGLTMSAEEVISELHGSAEYRTHLMRVMCGRAVAAAG